MADMHFMYGLADGNSFSPYYPRPKNLRKYESTIKRSRETEIMTMTVRTVQLKQYMLDVIEKDPDGSMRQIAHTLNISTVCKILMDNLLFRYHIQCVHALLPPDFPVRIALCQWYLTNFYKNHI